MGPGDAVCVLLQLQFGMHFGSELKPEEYPGVVGSMVDVLDKITGGSTEFGVPAHQQRVELQVMDQASKTLLNLEAGRLEGIYWLLVRFGVC